MILGMALFCTLIFSFWCPHIAHEAANGMNSIKPLLFQTETSSGKVHSHNKTLVYITTHLSKVHSLYLQYCWPTLIARSPLLSQADFMFFVTQPKGQTANLTLITSAFAGRRVSVRVMENPGYQEGAILALTEAVDHGWFDNYDWVIRLNPDVLIRNDTFLRERINDVRAHGIFVDCWDKECPTGSNCVDRQIHTDFFAVRPCALPPPDAFHSSNKGNAEGMATEIFASIVREGADSWVPRTGPHHGWCKVSGESSPVIHTHNFNVMYPACLSWYD
jgi:hypothetical protein